MSTTFSEIYRIFNGRLNDSDITKLDSNSKRKIFLENAVPDFQLSFRLLTVDYNLESITEDLTALEKKTFALFMLREYYRQEKVKYSKLVNLITDSTKMSGMGEVKKALEENLKEIEVEINQLLATLV